MNWAQTPLFLSPMVDVTDAAFRSLAAEWGADVTCSEMVGAAGLAHEHERSWHMATPWPGEAPYGVQIMGGDEETIAAAARLICERLDVDFIDINLGCPSPKILAACAGAFLLRDPPKAGRIVAAAVEASDVPVSVKARLGHDDDHRTYLAVADEVQAAGAKWMTLHGRTVVQGYSGKADWSAIERLVDHADIPVVGNGDVRDGATAVAMREQTGCQGIFIGRAAMNDPTCFQRLRAALNGREENASPDLHTRVALFEEYAQRATSIGYNVAHLKRQANRFITGVPGAKQARVAIQNAADEDELHQLLRSHAAPRAA